MSKNLLKLLPQALKIQTRNISVLNKTSLPIWATTSPLTKDHLMIKQLIKPQERLQLQPNFFLHLTLFDKFKIFVTKNTELLTISETDSTFKLEWIDNQGMIVWVTEVTNQKSTKDTDSDYKYSQFYADFRESLEETTEKMANDPEEYRNRIA